MIKILSKNEVEKRAKQLFLGGIFFGFFSFFTGIYLNIAYDQFIYSVDGGLIGFAFFVLFGILSNGYDYISNDSYGNLEVFKNNQEFKTFLIEINNHYRTLTKKEYSFWKKYLEKNYENQERLKHLNKLINS